VLADRSRGSGPALEVLCGGKVISMRMGVEDPLDRQSGFSDVVENGVGTARRRRSRFLIEVEDGIDDGAAPREPARHNVLNAEGQRFVEGFDDGLEKPWAGHG
jgi:hypothetical protein